LSDKLRQILYRVLSHPRARGLDLDDPGLMPVRHQILKEKKFLRRIYADWYQMIACSLSRSPGFVLELGSGAGFFKEHTPLIHTSDVFFIPGLSLVLDGQWMPFKDNSLGGLVMVNVFHHLSDIETFLMEATRCVQLGGRMIMVEPWATYWSGFVYTHFHHEEFDPSSVRWGKSGGGHLSGANGALPWIVFHRDRDRFEHDFPGWQINSIEPFMPLRYLLSGGISGRSLFPDWTYTVVKWFEGTLSSQNQNIGMFALIHLERVSNSIR
jgi:SAM-dependent methyltransferase